MMNFGAARKRLALRILAAIAVAAMALPIGGAWAQTSNNAAGPLVAVDAAGGDVHAFGASVTVTGTAANIWAVGASVDVSTKAAGSVKVFGGKVVLGGDVGADVAAMGSSIDYTARTGGNAKVAGGAVTIDGTVGGNLQVFGASLMISPLADVAGRLDVIGANVTMAGRVSGKARLAGAVVTFNGQAEGPVVLAGETVIVGPRAHIGGNLIVYSRQAPNIAKTAFIGGTVTRAGPPETLRMVPSWLWSLICAAAMVLGALLAGIVLMLFGGRLFLTALDYARLRPVSTIVIGIVTLILVPVIAAILGATVVGLPIALALLLAMPLFFVFGLPVAAAGIAAGIFVRTPGPIGVFRALLFVLLGAIVIALISLIPWVGALAVGVVIVLGVGALVRTAGGRLRTPRRPRSAAAPPAAPPPRPAATQPAEPPPPPPPPPEPPGEESERPPS